MKTTKRRGNPGTRFIVLNGFNDKPLEVRGRANLERYLAEHNWQKPPTVARVIPVDVRVRVTLGR